MLGTMRAKRRRDRKLQAAINRAKTSKRPVPLNDLEGLLPPSTLTSFSDTMRVPSVSSSLASTAVEKAVSRGIRRKSTKFFSRVFRSRRHDALETSASDASSEEEAVIPKKAVARENIELVLEKPSTADREDAGEMCVELIGEDLLQTSVPCEIPPSAFQTVSSEVSAPQTETTQSHLSPSCSEGGNQAAGTEDGTVASSVGLYGNVNLFGDDDEDWEGAEGVETTEYLQLSPKAKLEHHAPTRAATEMKKRNDDIWLACRVGDLRFVKRTIKETPELINLEHDGRTPLYHACRCGHRRIARLLLVAGARDDDGTTFQSALNNRMRKLLKHHLHYDPRTSDGQQEKKPRLKEKEATMVSLKDRSSLQQETEQGLIKPDVNEDQNLVYSPDISTNHISSPSEVKKITPESREDHGVDDAHEAVIVAQNNPRKPVVARLAITVVSGVQNTYGDTFESNNESTASQESLEVNNEEKLRTANSRGSRTNAIDLSLPKVSRAPFDEASLHEDTSFDGIQAGSAQLDKLDNQNDSTPGSAMTEMKRMADVRSQGRTARVNQVLEDLARSADESSTAEEIGAFPSEEVVDVDLAGQEELSAILDETLTDSEAVVVKAIDGKNTNNVRQSSKSKLRTLKRLISRSVRSVRSSVAESEELDDESKELRKVETMSLHSGSRIHVNGAEKIKPTTSSQKKIRVTRGKEEVETTAKVNRSHCVSRKENFSVDGGSLASVTAGKTIVRFMSHRDGYEDGFEVLLDDYVDFPPAPSNISTACHKVRSIDSQHWELDSDDDDEERSEGSEIDLIENLDIVRSFTEASSSSESETDSEDGDDSSGSSSSYSAESEVESNGSGGSEESHGTETENFEESLDDEESVYAEDSVDAEESAFAGDSADGEDSAYAEDSVYTEQSEYGNQSRSLSPALESSVNSAYCCLLDQLRPRRIDVA